MPRILLVLALIAGGLATVAMLVTGETASLPSSAERPLAGGLPVLDPLSVALGAIGGLLLSRAWAFPWGSIPEMLRALVGRSIRGLGLTGLAMIAAAIILFY